jgi:hypothetical protein
MQFLYINLEGKENQLQKPKELRELENEKYITSMSKEECIKSNEIINFRIIANMLINKLLLK